jgi:hypothetical protein
MVRHKEKHAFNAGTWMEVDKVSMPAVKRSNKELDRNP